MEEYSILGRIGEGAHGIILRGTSIKTGVEVALKKVLVKNMDDGIPSQIIREIKALQHVDSKFVMSLLDFFPHGVSFVLVFHFMPSGLTEMINDIDNPLTEGQIKSYARMLLTGISHLHQQGIMHRDLKPANLLIGYDGILKIGDFGLARMMWGEENKGRPYTHQVATRWYRAPEILYGAKHYTEAIDIWAVGCTLAEMYNKTPLFPGDTDIDQLALVIRNLGTPTETNWPGVSSLPDYNKITFPPSRPVSWEHLLPDVSPLSVSFIKMFITYDSSKRCSAASALTHHYFFLPPLPLEEAEMPKPPANHRQNLKQKEFVSLDSTNDPFVDFEVLCNMIM